MSINNFISEYLVLPVSDLLTGQCVFRQLQFLKRSAKWDEERMLAYQNKLFRELILHASSHVPYYREWFAANGALPEDFKTIEDVRSLPIVSKALMRTEGVDRFVADNVPERCRMHAHSSGSTGEPFSYYVSKRAYSINTAAKLRTWYDAGFRLGDSYVKLTSSPRESALKKIQDRITGGCCVSFNSLDDVHLAEILNLFEKRHPSVIRAHPNAMYYLARYRQQHPDEYHFSPRVIFTTTSNLPASFRKTITEVFNCDVIDSYSCEGTPNTAENTLHDGYHVSKEYGLVEVLDENGSTVKNGCGQVVSTDFWSYAMPFIRYDTQDVVQVDDQGVIIRILGRECELIESPNGRRYTGQVIEDFFIYNTNHSVQAFQAVCYSNPQRVLFRLIVDQNFTSSIEASIVDYWQKELDLPVEVQTVDKIPLMHNNKYLTVIHE